MSDACNGECSGCGESGCEQRQTEDFRVAPHPSSHIKRVIGIVSGKGGVGKSLVTSMLAVTLQRQGQQTAILDADITGPSIPRAFGIKDKALARGDTLLPVTSKTGVKIMSVNLLLENDTDPVVWRGPVIAGTVRQFWADVDWGEVDTMLVDLPPGTGDVPLTVFQSLPLDGIIVVATPQQLVGMIVQKAVKMAALMGIPVLALVENMSSFLCPSCGEKHALWGDTGLEAQAAALGIPRVVQLPLNPKLAAAADAGTIELFEQEGPDALAQILENLED